MQLSATALRDILIFIHLYRSRQLGSLYNSFYGSLYTRRSSRRNTVILRLTAGSPCITMGCL